MDLALLIVTALATAAAIVSAIVAIVQARAAKASEGDAIDARNESRKARDESAALAAQATAAFVRQADAQEKANAMKEAELAPRAWSGPRWVSGHLYRMINSSMRTIKVDHFDVQPDGAERRINLRGPQDGIYEYGDSFDYVLSQAMQMQARKLVIHWRFEDEPDAPLNEWIIPL